MSLFVVFTINKCGTYVVTDISQYDLLTKVL